MWQGPYQFLSNLYHTFLLIALPMSSHIGLHRCSEMCVVSFFFLRNVQCSNKVASPRQQQCQALLDQELLGFLLHQQYEGHLDQAIPKQEVELQFPLHLLTIRIWLIQHNQSYHFVRTNKTARSRERPWLVSIVFKISSFTAFVLAKLLYNEMTIIVLYFFYYSHKHLSTQCKRFPIYGPAKMNRKKVSSLCSQHKVFFKIYEINDLPKNVLKLKLKHLSLVLFALLFVFYVTLFHLYFSRCSQQRTSQYLVHSKSNLF